MQMVGQSNLHESLQQTAHSLAETPAARARPTHDEAQIVGDTALHYHIADDQSEPLLFGDWLRENSCDSALEVRVMPLESDLRPDICY